MQEAGFSENSVCEKTKRDIYFFQRVDAFENFKLNWLLYIIYYFSIQKCLSNFNKIWESFALFGKQTFSKIRFMRKVKTEIFSLSTSQLTQYSKLKRPSGYKDICPKSSKWEITKTCRFSRNSVCEKTKKIINIYLLFWAC